MFQFINLILNNTSATLQLKQKRCQKATKDFYKNKIKF